MRKRGKGREIARGKEGVEEASNIASTKSPPKLHPYPSPNRSDDLPSSAALRL